MRFRPIMMTTMAALVGTLPIALGYGAGAESRRPLGLAVVGGLLVSQLLTLYITPVYLRLHRRHASMAREAAVLPRAPRRLRAGRGPDRHAERRERRRRLTPERRPTGACSEPQSASPLDDDISAP